MACLAVSVSAAESCDQLADRVRRIEDKVDKLLSLVNPAAKAVTSTQAIVKDPGHLHRFGEVCCELKDGSPCDSDKLSQCGMPDNTPSCEGRVGLCFYNGYSYAM